MGDLQTASPITSRLLPPDIEFRGRLWSSDEVAAVAAAWCPAVHGCVDRAATAVAVVLANHPESIALFFAVANVGLPLVVLSPDPQHWRCSPPYPDHTPLFLPPSLGELAPLAAAVGLSAHTLAASRAGGSAPSVRAPGFVTFTSGSTAAPKPVYITTRAFLQQAQATAGAYALPPGLAVAASLPLASHYGFGHGLLLASALRGRLGLLPKFDHRSLLALCADERYAYWAATPLMADILWRAPAHGDRLRVPPICHVSAGRLPEPVFHGFRSRYGVSLRPSYGRTECGLITVETAPEGEVRPDAVGRVTPGVQLRVGDDPEHAVSTGRLGRVWLRSPWAMQGYGFPPELEREHARNGWWPTEDLGTLDEAGYLTLAGRTDDCFKTVAGYLANPDAIARALASHPGVVDVVVVPVARPSGPVVGAVVEGDAVEPLALRALAAHTLPTWLQPAALIVTRELPRLPGGKPDRRACISMLERTL